MRFFILLVVLFPFGCKASDLFQQGERTIEAGKQFVEEGKRFVDEGKKVVDGLKTQYEQARMAADLNKDGKISGFDEWQALLLGLGTLVVGGGGAMMARNGKSNERKAKMEARLDALEASAE